ncbi:hypothetical protein VD0003_g6540 [Verticillium dahliae]|nr:hypothetical protein VD0003_g6540 [Verticillium dahliae]
MQTTAQKSRSGCKSARRPSVRLIFHKFYAGEFWCRVSGQIYWTMDDFEWAAKTLQQLCERAIAGEWR